jgi:hypothetical protein
MTGKPTLTVETADEGIVQGKPTSPHVNHAEYYAAGSEGDRQAKRASIHRVMDENPLLVRLVRKLAN